MSTRPGAHRHEVRVTAAVFIGGDVEVTVQPMAEWDRVVVHLDHRVALHLDRDGLALLASAADRAETELDAAEDEMAAAIEATLTGTPVETPDGIGVERISA